MDVVSYTTSFAKESNYQTSVQVYLLKVPAGQQAGNLFLCSDEIISAWTIRHHGTKLGGAKLFWNWDVLPRIIAACVGGCVFGYVVLSSQSEWVEWSKSMSCSCQFVPWKCVSWQVWICRDLGRSHLFGRRFVTGAPGAVWAIRTGPLELLITRCGSYNYLS